MGSLEMLKRSHHTGALLSGQTSVEYEDDWKAAPAWEAFEILRRDAAESIISASEKIVGHQDVVPHRVISEWLRRARSLCPDVGMPLILRHLDKIDGRAKQAVLWLWISG